MGGKWGKRSDNSGREDRQRKAGGQKIPQTLLLLAP